MKTFPLSLRGKLTVWYVTSTTILFSLLLGVFAIWLWYLMNYQIDHHVHIVISEAQGIVTRYPEHQREQLLRNLVSARGMTVVLLSPDGNPILQTNSPDIAAVSEHEMQQILSVTRHNQEPVHFSVGSVRFASVPVALGENRGILAVGYSTSIIQESFTTIAISVFVMAAISLGSTGLLGYLMIRRYLRPLEEISHTASKISNLQNLDERAPTNQSSSELQTIASAMNRMLTQLQESFRKEHEFFTDAAHTLKTPLAVLRSQVEQITENTKRKRLILSTIDSAVETIQDLFFISRIHLHNPLERENLNLTSVLEELTELAAALGADKRIEVITEISQNLTVSATPHLLKRSLGNIVKNAVEHTPEKGYIKIVSHQDVPNKSIHISISNSGPGINSDDLPHIFERFYQGKNSKRSGSGLGLAISQAIILDLGGSIAIDSQPNKLTTVTIRLPAK
jgi:signal transduction histidine kinase